MEGIVGGSGVLPSADGVPEAAPAAVSASSLSPDAVDFVPGMATRVVAPKTSRGSSPHSSSALLAASPTSGIASASTGTGILAAGQAVVLIGLSLGRSWWASVAWLSLSTLLPRATLFVSTSPARRSGFWRRTCRRAFSYRFLLLVVILYIEFVGTFSGTHCSIGRACEFDS